MSIHLIYISKFNPYHFQCCLIKVVEMQVNLANITYVWINVYSLPRISQIKSRMIMCNRQLRAVLHIRTKHKYLSLNFYQWYRKSKHIGIFNVGHQTRLKHPLRRPPISIILYSIVKRVIFTCMSCQFVGRFRHLGDKPQNPRDYDDSFHDRVITPKLWQSCGKIVLKMSCSPFNLKWPLTFKFKNCVIENPVILRSPLYIKTSGLFQWITVRRQVYF